MLFDYDDRSLESVYNYAKKLEQMTFNQILDEYNKSDTKKYINKYDLSNLKIELHDKVNDDITNNIYEVTGHENKQTIQDN